MFIDAEKLKDKLGIEEHKKIMKSMGFRLYREDEKEIRYYTDICHGGTHPKLFFYKDIKLFVCYSNCGNHSLYSMVMKVRKCNFHEALEYCCDVCDIPYESNQRINAKKENVDDWESMKKYLKTKRQANELKIFDKYSLNLFEDVYYEGWINEGITIEVMKLYNIKWYPYRSQIVIPCYDEYFNLIGVRVRNLLPEAIEKGYKYMPLETLRDSFAFPTNKALYGIHFNKQAIMRFRKIILFEGEKSVQKLHVHYMEDNYSVALYSSNIGEFRRDMILKMGVEEVIIGYDFDYHEYGNEEYELYEEKCFKAGALFKAYCKVTVLCSHGGHSYKDSPIDKGIEFFEELMKNREEIN